MVSFYKGYTRYFYIFIFVIFDVFYNASVFATQFKEVDFIKSITEHPLYRQYDPATGRFKNTNSEIIPTENLKKEIEELKKRRDELTQKRNELANDGLAMILGESGDSWKEIKIIDEELTEINKKLLSDNELLKNEGIPHFTVLIPQIESMVGETLASITSKISSDTIVINKLPLYYKNFKPIDFNNEYFGYGAFLKNCSNLESLNNYLNNERNIHFIFPLTRKSVIYQRGEKK